MKLGFYDSGLGGISVLREFVQKYGHEFSYVYFGDSARAPYGNRTQEELLGYIQEIMDYMQEKQVDIVISACNTTSMLINKLDLAKYTFQTMNLFEVMNDFFLAEKLVNNMQEQIALLATSSNIDSLRYRDWQVNIYPVKCPSIVPLVETGNLKMAKEEWDSYLTMLPDDITKVIVGCTHYEFLVEKDKRFKFISPARESVKYFAKKFKPIFSGLKKESEMHLDIYFSMNLKENLAFAKDLLALNPRV